tara:strand:+ start:464 stop:2080 length:1617 start_codon:yes stop_codon:yes gene_type:complete
MNWLKQAKLLYWSKFPSKESAYTFKKPEFFVDGGLNVCYNCVDRHASEKTAIIWENEEGKRETITYSQLLAKVSSFATGLKKHVKKGEVVTLYMPLIPEAIIAMLACARIGVIHNVVFSAFGSDALQKRMKDGKSKLVITADVSYHNGKKDLLQKVRKINPKKTIVLRREKTTLQENEVDWKDVAQGSCECKEMHAEDTLFMLYTSGSTGKPKQVVHSTGGYLTQVAFTTKEVFGLTDKDVFWCTADIGWITGHSYVVYGPLSLGATIYLFEGSWVENAWELVKKNNITVFYTAPTAIRMLMQGKKPNNLPLRLVGSVGEPLNPEAWQWYKDATSCPIVDTYWQTETGSIMITTLPSEKEKAGVAGKPLGVEADIVDNELVFTTPWPSMARNLKVEDVYHTGDEASKDDEGYYQILGRRDDCFNVAGHLLSTAEIENVLVGDVEEAAVVGVKDEVKGEVPIAFVVGKEINEKNLQNKVRKELSPLAVPKRIIVVDDLPKTRSGKIMRRVLKNLIEGKEVGDVSTLANPESVEKIQSIL